MWRTPLIVVAMLLVAVPTFAADLQFDRDIRPILSNHCFQCHGPDEGTREAGLRLDTPDGLRTESDFGTVAVVPGMPADSELLRRVTAHDVAERMPPAEIGKPLTSQQVDTLRRWIEQGAPWQQHWAYTPPVRPAVPPLPDDASLVHAIDRFLQQRWQQAKLSPSAAADPVTLVRRLSFDLTGLPPDIETVEAFAADPSYEAYATLVERLLESRHYGERMALYWLDLVRYADSCGYHSDNEQRISPYRDYVIRAFNQNLPFDQFTREQLAGDLLPEPTLEQRVATGYNRLNKTTEEGGAQDGEYLAKSAADRVRTTAGVWLAATLGCAECHDHKYDPFTARDFYSFAAFFADVQERGVYGAGKREPEIAVPTAEQSAELARLADQLSQCEAEAAAQSQPDAALTDRIANLKKARADLDRLIPRSMVTVAVTPREVRILPRGDWLDSTGEIVEPAIPAFLLSTAPPERRLTRLDLADWLVSADNPLTSRVFVNRLWKMFFGVGLSRYLDDLGAQGERPTHPELLDWLAVEFIDSGWDVKHMVRLLVTSHAYQQLSIPTPEQLAIDPQNRLFARQSRWRLEAEFIRDGALSASGLLSPQIGGPSVKPYQPEGYWDFLNFPKRKYKHDTGEKQYRRGLYTHWQRTFLHPSLLAFDASTREECMAERPVSNTPKAALALLNDPTFVEAARVLAANSMQSADADDDARLTWIWRRVLSRAPTPEEAALLADLLSEARTSFQEDLSSALALLSVGQANRPDDLPPAELAAWTMVARAVLNSSEAITRN